MPARRRTTAARLGECLLGRRVQCNDARGGAIYCETGMRDQNQANRQPLTEIKRLTVTYVTRL